MSFNDLVSKEIAMRKAEEDTKTKAPKDEPSKATTSSDGMPDIETS